MIIKRIKANSLWLCSSLMFVQSLAAEEKSKEREMPNIVFLIADDVTRDDFGCYGHPLVKTPNIDALATDGIRFDNMFLTASSSSPSRCSIITGRYPHNHGACELSSPIGEEQVSFVELLKAAGYYTTQAGKWHLGNSTRKPAGPLLRAFDRTGGSKSDGGGPGGENRWVEFLKERPVDKPFFMWFAAHDAHRTWDDDRSLERYHPDDVAVPCFFVDDEATREDFASYYYEISRFDYFVGKVVEELKHQGVYDNTLIIVMADNGRPFVRSKARLLVDGVRTPFVVHCPKTIPHKVGSVCTSLVSSVDLAPTVMDIVGVESSKTFQGRSFKTLFKRPDKKFRRYAFAEHNWHDFEAYERMICTDRYLLIMNARPELTAEGPTDVVVSPSEEALRTTYIAGTLDSLQMDIFVTPRAKYELYDYVNDPIQEYELSSQEPKILKKMCALLEQWQQETGDDIPEKLTPDWYIRGTNVRTSAYKERREMPGTAHKAVSNNCSGPF